jgi:hypothetical protein
MSGDALATDTGLAEVERALSHCGTAPQSLIL